MRYTREAIEGSLHILAKALSDDLGVRVVMGGARACTDGKLIRLPALPADDRRARLYGLGYIVHETGHVEDTDFEAYSQFALKSPLHEALLNIFEDVRVELARMRRYPGAKLTLGSLVAAMVEDGKFVLSTDAQATPAVLLQEYLLYRLRFEVLGQLALEPLARAADARAAALLPAVKAEVDAILFDIRSAASTADAVRISERLIEVLRRNASPPPNQGQAPPQAAPDGETPDRGNADCPVSQDVDSANAAEQEVGAQPNAGCEPPGVDDADGVDDGEAEYAKERAPEHGAGTEPATQASSDPGADAASASSQSGEDDAAATTDGSGLPDAAECGALQAMLDASEAERLQDFGERVAHALGDIAEQSDNMLELPEAAEFEGGPTQDAHAVLSEVRSQSNALRTRLRTQLEAVARSHPFIARRGTRIEGRRLYRLALGDSRIFRRQVEGAKLETAVQLLIDRSSSTSGEVIELSKLSAAALAAAVEGLGGVDLSIALFPMALPGQGGPAEGVGVVKPFGAPLRKVAGRLPWIRAAGGTPLAPAMLWAGLNLLRQNRSRRVLFVLTDGEPDNTAQCLEVLADLRRMRIEPVGLGVQHDVGHLFEVHGRVDQLAELPRAVFAMLSRQLLEAA